MKRNSFPTSSRHRRPGFLALAIWILAVHPALAASDTDVDLLKVSEVRIEKDMITIVAEAVVTMRNISDRKDPVFPRAQLVGRPVNISRTVADKATFVLVRPRQDAGFWQGTLDTARALKAGKPISRIAFYRPEVVIRANLVVSIHGEGLLVPLRDPPKKE